MLKKTLENPLDCKEIKPVSAKFPLFNPKYSLEGLILKLKLQYFDNLMRRSDLLEKILMLGKIKGRSRRAWQRMRWLNRIIDSMDMNLSKLREIVKDRGDWHSPVHGTAKSQTWLSDGTTIKSPSPLLTHWCYSLSVGPIYSHLMLEILQDPPCFGSWLPKCYFQKSHQTFAVKM